MAAQERSTPQVPIAPKAVTRSLVYFGGRYYVRAYDGIGDDRPFHLVGDDDRIEWKRRGSPGFKIARVVICDAPMQQLCVQPINRDGAYAGRRRWIGAGTVMRVYDGPHAVIRRRPVSGPLALDVERAALAKLDPVEGE